MMRWPRRRFLQYCGGLSLAGGLATSCGAGGGGSPSDQCAAAQPAGTGPTPPVSAWAAQTDEALLDDLAQRTFRFFWEHYDANTGLVPDRWPGNPELASVAALGFALTAYVVGVDRAWVTRAEALQRSLLAVRFLHDAPQGSAATGTAVYKGFFYHYLNMKTGVRFDTQVELSSIDTSLLLAGLICVQQFFDGRDALETELRTKVQTLHERIDWRWMQQRSGLVCMGWLPGKGFLPYDYRGYDEAMWLVLLAMGSPVPAQRISADSWQGFTATYDWGDFMGQTHLTGAPLFWHQYSQMWVDFRGIRDEFMRAKGIDYFENSRRATLAQRAYAKENKAGFNGYDELCWGLTACDGPGVIRGPDHLGCTRDFFDYRARGAGRKGTFDDGTISPTAALSSIAFAPQAVKPTLRAMLERHGSVIYGDYGFFDSFNLSYRAFGSRLVDGRDVPGWGWVASDYLGIDQGPILGMIANYRNELIWTLMKKSPDLQRGLRLAGFSGGWL